MTNRVAHHLSRIYPHLDDDQLDSLVVLVQQAVGIASGTESNDAAPKTSQLPGSAEVVLITYGDTILNPYGPHLHALDALWATHLANVFSTAHVLPFFPSSSDGGFSIVDYRRVAPELGDWHDLNSMVAGRDLMIDLVCNHGSAQSDWFADFIADRPPGRDYYLTADPDDDLGMVTRPRTHPLLAPVRTASGLRHVWATFSHDQLDFDFSNPDVLVEFCAILGFYLAQGATRVRLDAIAYLWKQIGTTCIHLPQTHQVVKLMRLLMSAKNPDALLITETNVPHAENVSYFGDGDEAHVVYNFTLAPLIVWSLVAQRGDTLTNWLGRLPAPPPNCTFLNFIASHDGIGLRPIEDLIPAAELTPMIEAATAVGGQFSEYSAPGGPRPYELNVSLADLLAGPDGETTGRYLAAHAVMLVVQGIPAFYVHSMLVSPGDIETAASTGHKRDINRARISLDDAHQRLTTGWRADVFAALAHLIEVRRSHTAFRPESPQTVHVLDPQVVAVERGSDDDRLLAVQNMSGRPVRVAIPTHFGTTDILTGDVVTHALTLGPWQARWLT